MSRIVYAYYLTEDSLERMAKLPMTRTWIVEQAIKLIRMNSNHVLHLYAERLKLSDDQAVELDKTKKVSVSINGTAAASLELLSKKMRLDPSAMLRVCIDCYLKVAPAAIENYQDQVAKNLVAAAARKRNYGQSQKGVKNGSPGRVPDALQEGNHGGAGGSRGGNEPASPEVSSQPLG